MEEQNIDRREEARRHPTRRALLGLLGEGEMTTRELRDRLPDEPTLSDVVYHLAVLRAVGSVEGPVDGRYRAGALNSRLPAHPAGVEGKGRTRADLETGSSGFAPNATARQAREAEGSLSSPRVDLNDCPVGPEKGVASPTQFALPD